MWRSSRNRSDAASASERLCQFSHLRNHSRRADQEGRTLCRAHRRPSARDRSIRRAIRRLPVHAQTRRVAGASVRGAAGRYGPSRASTITSRPPAVSACPRTLERRITVGAADDAIGVSPTAPAALRLTWNCCPKPDVLSYDRGEGTAESAAFAAGLAALVPFAGAHPRPVCKTCMCRPAAYCVCLRDLRIDNVETESPARVSESVPQGSFLEEPRLGRTPRNSLVSRNAQQSAGGRRVHCTSRLTEIISGRRP